MSHGCVGGGGGGGGGGQQASSLVVSLQAVEFPQVRYWLVYFIIIQTGQIKLMEDDKENGHFSEEEEEGSSSDNNYDEAVILPRYSIRDRTKDPQLGGYIDVQLAGGQQRKGGPEETPLVGKVDVVQGEEGVGLLAARSVDFNKLGEPETEEIERPTTPNKYLTILRDNGETAMGGGKPPPPIPKHMHKG